MGTQLGCKIMVGLEYEIISNNVDDVEKLDEDISYGELDCGSCYYDSPYDGNIIGFDVATTSEYKEIDGVNLMVKITEATLAFVRMFPALTPKIYLTLNVT